MQFHAYDRKKMWTRRDKMILIMNPDQKYKARLIKINKLTQTLGLRLLGFTSEQ